MESEQERLQRRFIEALRNIKKFRLFLRPYGIKFDEGGAIVRLDLDGSKGFSIGDSCIHLPSDISPKCLIAAFVEMTGYLKGGHGIKIKDIFYVLASPNSDGDSRDNYRFLKAQDGSIYLFQLDDLKKVEKE